MRIAVTLGLMIGAMSLSVAAAANEDETRIARAPSEMTGAEIDAYNQGRPATSPDYIRCRKVDQVGSLVRKLRVCNTNAGWRQATEKSSQDARDTMEVMARGWSNSAEPKDDILRGGYNSPK